MNEAVEYVLAPDILIHCNIMNIGYNAAFPEEVGKSSGEAIQRQPPIAVSIRIVDDPADAEALLPVSVFSRLGPDEVPSPCQRLVVYLSRLVVALEGDSVVGFSAFLAPWGSICAAHEFWVDAHARTGEAPVAMATLAALETAARQAGCSQLFVVMKATSLRPILQNAGYSESRAAFGLIWFEKSLVTTWVPAACA